MSHDEQTAGISLANETTPDRRAEILQATIKTIADVGITGATMKRVAEEAGVSPALLFHYYRNKKELIAAAMASTSVGIHRRVDEATGYDFGLKRLRTMYELILKNSDGKQAPPGFWIELISECLRDEDIRSHELASIESSRGYLRRSVDAWREQGELDANLDPDLLVDLLIGVAWGLRLLNAVDPKLTPDRAVTVANTILDLMASSRVPLSLTDSAR